ncbi:hypothetical protein [Xylanimonas ulmi]|uniref:Membrane protein YmcC n=1 Tax=Xylanimonas ulmi TaxID=228973 RepID=A0A4Q7M1H0_9MICO|nr:hypothetical protein [Xylanibacterium ulmi]RZS61254.1 hypothetical protein EV386_1549 [Xylanibacterium ulmi]
MILTAILACEVGFWVAIVAGLTARYVLRRPRLGAGLLISAPALDVVLLALVAVDLARGGAASWQHGLAAIYIGVSGAYGRPMVAWVDVRFAHRFAGGPPPQRLSGARHTAKCWRDVGRTIVMGAIASAISGGLIWWVDDASRTAELTVNFRIVGLILAIDTLWALSYTIWPKQTPQQEAAEAASGG